MEVNLTGRLRRTEQTVRPDGTKKSAPETESSAAEPQKDTLSLTRQAIAQLEEQSQRLAELLEQSQREPQERKKPAIWDIMDGAESGGAESERLGEELKVMQRCHKIAARIMRGDKVPPQDEQYLMQNDPDGYKLAMAMRRPKKHPKEWESVLKDEDKAAKDSGGEEPAPSCEGASEASDGGDSASAE